jgi:hypothetical protein
VGAVGIYVGLSAAVAFIGVQAKLNLFIVTHGAMVVVLMGCEGWLVVVLLMWKKQIPADPTGEMEKVRLDGPSNHSNHHTQSWVVYYIAWGRTTGKGSTPIRSDTSKYLCAQVVKALEANPELTKWLSLSFLAFQVISHADDDSHCDGDCISCICIVSALSSSSVRFMKVLDGCVFKEVNLFNSLS